MNTKTRRGVRFELRKTFWRVRREIKIGERNVSECTLHHIVNMVSRHWRGVASYAEIMHFIHSSRWGERFARAVEITRERWLQFPGLRRKLKRLLRHNLTALLRAQNDSRYHTSIVKVEYLQIESMVDFILRNWNRRLSMTKKWMLRIIQSTEWGVQFMQTVDEARAEVLALISETKRPSEAIAVS